MIGLDKNGYGRILSQCMFTAKVLYCLWVALAEDTDYFVVQPTMPLESTSVPEDPIAFIRKYILEKENDEIAKVKEMFAAVLIYCRNYFCQESLDDIWATFFIVAIGVDKFNETEVFPSRLVFACLINLQTTDHIVS